MISKNGPCEDLMGDCFRKKKHCKHTGSEARMNLGCLKKSTEAGVSRTSAPGEEQEEVREAGREGQFMLGLLVSPRSLTFSL